MDTFYVNDTVVRGLLWYVLQHGRRQECSEGCLERVLAWGVRPHVVSACNGDTGRRETAAAALARSAAEETMDDDAIRVPVRHVV